MPWGCFESPVEFLNLKLEDVVIKSIAIRHFIFTVTKWVFGVLRILDLSRNIVILVLISPQLYL